MFQLDKYLVINAHKPNVSVS